MRIGSVGRVRIVTTTALGRTVIDVPPSDLTIVVDGGPTIVVRANGTGARKALKRGRGLPVPTLVSLEMETAAVAAFLAGADTGRLGRSLSAVYEAMDAVRREQEARADDED